MGPTSADGPGQNNPDRSEGPWGGVEPYSKAAHQGVFGPTQSGTTDSDYEVREGRMQTVSQLANAGSRLKPFDASGRHRLICQPSSRTGENPPYGMIGGTVEPSASFEARYAPLSYPTEGDAEWLSYSTIFI
jgi:hypothetical protein